MSDYPDILLHIAGRWRAADGGKTIPVINPATEEQIGTVAHASKSDLDAALEATKKGFAVWRKTSAYDRSKIMRKAADLLRERAGRIARLMTLEQGKPLKEAKVELMTAADTTDWFAEEARRAYGRVVPARKPEVYQLVLKEPVGRSPLSHRGIFRSTRWCANYAARWPPAARSSSRRRRRRRDRRPN